MIMLYLLFYVCLLYLIYVYATYYLIVSVASVLTTKRLRRDNSLLPTVSMIISAYNEEKIIGDKIRNTLELDYPKNLLQIIVVSDASDDNTDLIVRGYAPAVTLLRLQERSGKTSGLNAAVKQATGEIVVFSDANSLYKSDALRKLVRNFADASTGFVTGESQYKDIERSVSGRTEGLYWKYEMGLKLFESKIGSMVGADGAIYAIRRNLYEPLQPEDINDFVNPLQIVAKGYRGIYEPEAVCYEETAGDLIQEFRRKRRIVNRSWRGLFKVKQVLNVFRFPIFSIQLLSHKLLRWLVPFVLILFLIVNFCLSTSGPLYAFTLALQIIVYGLALIGFCVKKYKSDLPAVFAFPLYFCIVNLASLLGIIDSMRGTTYVTWTPPKRSVLQFGEDGRIGEIIDSNKKTILFLAHRIPYPPDKGDRIRSFNEIKHLSQHYNVILATTLDKRNHAKYILPLMQYCADIKAVYFYRPLALLTNILSRKPFSVAYFYNSSLQKFVNRVLTKRKVDSVICFCSSMAEYIFRASGLKNHSGLRPKLIMDYVDLDSDKWQQYSRYSNFFKSILYKMEFRRLSSYEILVNNFFDTSVFIADRERKVFQLMHPGAGKIEVIQNGVDSDYFKPNWKREQHAFPVLLFTGIMNYYANEDGVNWFCAKILPLIKERIGEVEFYIVGSNPTRTVRRLSRIRGVHVTGYVPDILQYYWMADVCVIPLRIARGLQNKVLEAMATGNAVVATSNASEGILCRKNHDLVVADDPAVFSQNVVDIIQNPEKRMFLATNAVNNIEKNYSWNLHMQRIDTILDSLKKNGPGVK